MEQIKKLLQNLWENVWYNAKMFFKSHDITQRLQFILLFLPSALWVISLAMDWIKILDIIILILWIFALVYFIYYGKNQELFMERWERYLELYHEIESYFKLNKIYEEDKIEELKLKISLLNKEKKPNYHIWVKNWVENTINKEMTYANEEKPWYK